MMTPTSAFTSVYAGGGITVLDWQIKGVKNCGKPQNKRRWTSSQPITTPPAASGRQWMAPLQSRCAEAGSLVPYWAKGMPSAPTSAAS